MEDSSFRFSCSGDCSSSFSLSGSDVRGSCLYGVDDLMILDDFRLFADKRPDSHDASESMEASDMVCGSGVILRSSGWPKEEGV